MVWEKGAGKKVSSMDYQNMDFNKIDGKKECWTKEIDLKRVSAVWNASLLKRCLVLGYDTSYSVCASRKFYRFFRQDLQRIKNHDILFSILLRNGQGKFRAS